MTHESDAPALSQAWHHFNHETRLALHTLAGSLQLAKNNASAAQLAHIGTAERCSARVLELLENYAGSEGESVFQAARYGGSAAAHSSAPAADSLHLPNIPASELATFQELVNTGQLLRVEEWATDLADVYVEFAEVCDALGYYAGMADLPSLHRVAIRWRKQMA